MKKDRISKKKMEGIHPAIPEAYKQLEQGRISRREFLRLSTLLGMYAGVASIAAACAAPAEEPAAEAPAVEEEAAPVSGIKRGGTCTSSMQLQLLDHPKSRDHRRNEAS